MFSKNSFMSLTWRFIKPEIEELVLYVLAILAFAGTAFYSVIINKNTQSTDDISGVFSLLNDKLLFITNGDDTVAKLFTFGLWFIIGTLVYALACFVVAFSNGAFKDVAMSSSYVHPSTFNKSNFWLAVASRALIRLAAVISLCIYTAVWFAVCAPTWLASFRGILIDGVNAASLSDIGIAIIGICLSLHVGAILVRLILLRSTYSYNH